MFSEEDKGKRDDLTSIYGVAMAFATELGPFVGEAAISDHNRDWRWTFWWTCILLGTSLLWLLPLSETYNLELRRSDISEELEE